MTAQGLLLVVALWSAWRPAETAAETALLVSGAVLVLAEWAWRRTGREAGAAWTGALLTLGALLLCSSLAGPDLATGLQQLALLAGGLALAWSASRQRAPAWAPKLLALGLAVLALWAVWQVAFGFEQAWSEVAGLPEELRTPIAARLADGRAFASLPFPGHLAAILATALPLLVGAVGRSPMGIACGVGVGFCGVGLLLCRSPIGVGLAVIAAAMVLVRRRAVLAAAGAVLAVILVVVVLARPDVRRLEPVKLRLDNWATALWIWGKAPLSGVGLGGFGLSAQSVPLDVGNRPAHAHCLPLELAAELGLPGCLAAVAAGAWLLRLLNDLWRRRPDLAAALAVVPLHNLVDFSSYVSAVALPWAVLVGWALAETREEPPRRDRDTGRQALVVAAALALALAALQGTSVVVERFAAGAPDATSRFEAALTAHRLAPWRVRPLGALAVEALESGDPSRLELADLELERARFLRTGSAGLAELRGKVALARGRVPTAVAELSHAVVLRPADERLAGSVAALAASLSAVRPDHER